MMNYSEIKTLINNYSIGSVRFIYRDSNKDARDTILRMDNATDVINAMLDPTQGGSWDNQMIWMINAVDIFLQIENVVGNLDQSAELLYKIIVDDEIDVSTEKYRAIHENYINEIFVNEIKDDSYKLGSFSADLIAEATGWPYELIKAAQKGESFSEIGDAMTIEQIKKLVGIHVRNDGYAYHFAKYDSQTHDIRKDELAYYLFRIS